ncbi:3-hydroxyacyl-CoA dehydrogenase [Rhodobacterales bacterium HKCCE3408]|nr:3-hydroxyacyl-CoA dehydrogenase [Rhodobacterales bacterium HKCCE3408]
MGAVATEIVGRIGLIGFDSPPVNAAGHALRMAIVEAMAAMAAEPGVEAIGLYGKGRAFIAGADITEFGKPPRDPWLPEVCNVIEASAKPVVAVLHGAALGGGLEVAISAHARIAVPGVAVGFPEVTLGVIPGAGGTQRGPRLTGIPKAIGLITTGRRIGADEALEMGLVDRIADGDPRELALHWAEAALTGELPTRRTGGIAVTPDDAALDAAEAQLRETQGHLFAPHKCVEAIRACTGPLPEGLAIERAGFNACIESPQRAGLIHAFFAERAVQKIPEAGATARDITKIGVIGAGTMGSGIASAFLLAGYPVTMVERAQDALDRGISTVGKNLDGAVKRGRMAQETRDALPLTATTEMGDLSGCDLVIEAVFEDFEVKREVLSAMEDACPGAILATNTSYLDVNALAQTLKRPEEFIGLHFFSPAHVMKLLEVVVGDRTAPEVTATAFKLGKRLGKIAVRSGVCDGFIGNRVMNHYRKAADHLVLDGASPQEIDAAMRGFGFAMGPFEVSDLAGLDIGWATRKRHAATRHPDERYSTVADTMCENGWLGRKTGRGWYLYEGGSGPNPEVAPLIEAERVRHGIAPRSFTAEEIVERYMTAMISEASRVVEEGIALRPIDVDAVFLFGYGFPRWRGGPMHHADTLGAAEIVATIERLAGDDPQFWQVPSILARMAETGGTFAEMNREE